VIDSVLSRDRKGVGRSVASTVLIRISTKPPYLAKPSSNNLSHA